MKSPHLSLDAKISECARGDLNCPCGNVGAVWTDNVETIYEMWILFNGKAA